MQNLFEFKIKTAMSWLLPASRKICRPSRLRQAEGKLGSSMSKDKDGNPIMVKVGEHSEYSHDENMKLFRGGVQSVQESIELPDPVVKI
jgi:hypothetical protein